MSLSLYLVTGIFLYAFQSVYSNDFRVVGGLTTEIRKFPYAAFLMFTCNEKKTGWACGSSILNRNTLLTASHCVDSFEVDSCHGMAFVGEEEKFKGRKHTIVKAIPHEKFNRQYIVNDIALLIVSPDIHYDSNVNCLMINRHVQAGSYGYLAGWGLIQERPMENTDILEMGKLKLWQRDVCMTMLQKSLPHGTFCAGGETAPQYAASGDSGSAIVVKEDSKLYGIGLVSFKYQERMTSMAVFTDLRYFYDWIAQHVALDCVH